MGQQSLTGNKTRFPSFCQADRFLGLMVAAELVALVMVLSSSAVEASFSWRSLGLTSILVQWIACFSAAILCAVRFWLDRLPLTLSYGLALTVILLMTAFASWASEWGASVMAPSLSPEMPLRDSLVRNLVIASLVGIAMLRYVYVQSEWQRQIEAKTEAQLKSLQARIRPHFLFNTLNAVIGMLRRQPEQAEQTLENLSDLFRAALTAPGRDHTLGAELGLCRRYMDIEQVRLGERLQLQWEVDELPKQLQVPALILQPLLENAIVHGIQQLSEGGTLSVSGMTGPQQIQITINNPIPEAGLRIAYDGGHGLALDNIRQRLQHRFVAGASLVTRQQNQQYQVVLTLPNEV